MNHKNLFTMHDNQGPVIDMPPLDTELNNKGRAVGTGAKKLYRVIFPLLIVTNTVLLTFILGTVFQKFFIESPIFILVGHATAFILLVIALVASGLFWCFSGNTELVRYIQSQFFFGTQSFQSICSLVLVFILLLVIFLRTYRHIYFSKKVLVSSLLGSCTVMILLLSSLLRHFGVI